MMVQLELSIDSCRVQNRDADAPLWRHLEHTKAKKITTCSPSFISKTRLFVPAFAHIIAVLALSACGQKPPVPPNVLATPSQPPTVVGDTERDVEDQKEVPEFPWPPPKASASDIIPRELLVGNAAHPTLGTVARAIESAFQQAGYGEKSYYSVPRGFAMASRMEQMNQDGSSKGSADRWSLEVPRMSRFSLSLYLTALFRGRSGYYRVIVFVVTSQPFSQSSAKITSEDAGVWVSSGLNKLPEKIANQEYSPAHTCTALIYEFKRTEGRRAEFVDPSEITGPIHLEKSGLMAAFPKPR